VTELQTRRVFANAVLSAGLVGSIVLRIAPPTEGAWYPECPIYRYLHVLCPGCGATRALAALLRGDLGGALGWNMLFVAMLPLLLLYGAASYRRAMAAGEFRWPQAPGCAVCAALGCAVLSTLVRNGILSAM
jgi:hypothetical protein